MSKTDKMKDEVIRELDKEINNLRENGNIEDSLILELSKTAIWLTKCAEYYKNKIAITKDLEKKNEYLVLVRTFYDLKLKIAKLLLKTDKVTIEFFRPKIRHKLNNLKMCETHKKEFEKSNAKELISFLYENNNFNEIYNCDKCEYDLIRNFYCLYYLTIKVGDISIILYIPHVLLKDEKEVNKSLKVINWKKGTEGVIFKDKSIFKGKAILKNISFSKKQFVNSFKELKLLLDNKYIEKDKL